MAAAGSGGGDTGGPPDWAAVGSLGTSWHAAVGELKKHDTKLMDAAKTRARGDLKLSQWMQQGHAYAPELLAEPGPSLGTIAREHAATLSVADFVRRYEEPNVPVILEGCADGWAAARGAWDPAALYAAYRHRR